MNPSKFEVKIKVQTLNDVVNKKTIEVNKEKTFKPINCNQSHVLSFKVTSNQIEIVSPC